MAEYLLIESRDPFDSKDVDNYYDLAIQLVEDGNKVTLFLLQNGVLPARQSDESMLLGRVADAGVEVLADDFSLRERGITDNQLTQGVQPAPLDTVIDQLAAGRKTHWHYEADTDRNRTMTMLTFAIMDAPFENTRSTTAMRLLEIATRRGYNVNVFAYEGVVGLPFAHQQPHPNAVHGHDVEEKNHPPATANG